LTDDQRTTFPNYVGPISESSANRNLRVSPDNFRRRVARDVEVQDATPIMADDKEAVEEAK